MIFHPELAQLVLSGHKTETRRAVKVNGTGKLVPCRYKPGKSYAIQPGRGKKAIGRLRVLDVGLQDLGAITEYEARREGFKNRTTFLLYWLRLYGLVKDTTRVWRIRFELVEPASSAQDHGLERVSWRVPMTSGPSEFGEQAGCSAAAPVPVPPDDGPQGARIGTASDARRWTLWRWPESPSVYQRGWHLLVEGEIPSRAEVVTVQDVGPAPEDPT